MKIKKSLSFLLASVLMLSSLGISNAASTTIRVSGSNRYETSMKTQIFNPQTTVVFANGNRYQDILSSLNIVNGKNARLVLVEGTEDMSDYVSKNNIKDVYVVGSNDSIPESFINNLKKVDINLNERISGKDDYDTNNLTLKIGGFKDVAISNPENYVDTLSAFKLLRNEHLGIKFFDTLNQGTMNGYNVKYTIGGLNSIPITYGQRIGGNNRYETSLVISNKTNSPNIVYVSGCDYADAMSAVNISMAKDADILLTPTYLNNNFVNKSKNANEIFVVGGESVLPNAMIDQTVLGKKCVDCVPDICKPCDECARLQKKQNNKKIVNKVEKKHQVSKVASKNPIDKKVVTNSKKGLTNTIESPLVSSAKVANVDGKNYLLNPNGEKILYNQTVNGVVITNDKAYILNTDSTLPTGFVHRGNTTYYQEIPNGLVRGWKMVNGNYRYFQPFDYTMLKSGAKSTGRTCYWFDNDGIVRVGNKPSGFRGIGIRWYKPDQSEYNNSWLNEPNQRARFKSQAIANYATDFDGLPFRWYGSNLNDRRGVYCCGAAYSAYHHFNVRIPGPNECNPRAEGGYQMVRVQYQQAPKFGGTYIDTNYNKMWPGDLAYSSHRGGYNHAAIYLGKNGGRPMYIHATLANGYIAEPASRVQSWGYYNLKSIRYKMD